jgi:hypothetical protein
MMVLLTAISGSHLRSQQVFDLGEDKDFDMGNAPDEPLPSNEDEESWQTDDEEGGEGDGEEIIQHFLGDHYDQNNRHTYRSKEAISYRERLERERKHWNEIQAQLVEAYLEFMSNGPPDEQEASNSDGEGSGWFTCEVSTLKGAFYTVPSSTDGD